MIADEAVVVINVLHGLLTPKQDVGCVSWYIETLCRDSSIESGYKHLLFAMNKLIDRLIGVCSTKWSYFLDPGTLVNNDQFARDEAALPLKPNEEACITLASERIQYGHCCIA